MATFVPAGWVEQNLDAAGVLVLDPRRPMRYLQGHIRNAVNLPVARAFDSDQRLLDVSRLSAWLGAAGLDDGRVPVVYDDADGRYAAMLVWILEYLGRRDVRLMDSFFGRWKGEGREVFYKPVTPQPRTFAARVRSDVRASLEDVRDTSTVTLVDVRSRDEYRGASPDDERPGHIPGAINLVWLELLGAEDRLLAEAGHLKALSAAHGIGPEAPLIVYCRTGVRAAIGYLAFQRLGLDVKLYDGSYLEWATRGLPVEREEHS